jgi:isochorismate hydrolase
MILLGVTQVAKLHSVIQKQFIEDSEPHYSPMLWPSSYGSQIVKDKGSGSEDYVVVKRRYDSFYQTDLEIILR